MRYSCFRGRPSRPRSALRTSQLEPCQAAVSRSCSIRCLITRHGVEETFGAAGGLEGNLHGVVVPAPSDESVIVFEDVVDVGLAVVRRQVVELRDDSGQTLLGLRDVFEAH